MVVRHFVNRVPGCCCCWCCIRWWLRGLQFMTPTSLITILNGID